MELDFREIHVGSFIKQKVTESGMETSRICNFLNCSPEDIKIMYNLESIGTKILLRWSKLLKYDFFRIYTQHLILYSPPLSTETKNSSVKNSSMPVFRKNIYTKELIDFILELIETKEKTKHQIVQEYKIPKTTLYKWISKYKK